MNLHYGVPFSVSLDIRTFSINLPTLIILIFCLLDRDTNLNITYITDFFFNYIISGGIIINIECKAWARNIIHDRKERIGSVHFELLID